MLVPNLFIAICAARYWSQLSLKFPSSSRLLMWIAVFVLGLSNLVSFGLPEHQHPSELQQAGDCVGVRLRSADLYISPEWDFGEFMSYKYKKDSMNLVGRTVELQYDNPKRLKPSKKKSENIRLPAETFIFPIRSQDILICWSSGPASLRPT